MEILLPFFNFALLFGVILGIGALSGYASERVGIINLGIDGMMIAGALFFGIISKYVEPLGNGSIFLTLFIVGILSMSVGALHGFATIVLKINHIISGVAINILVLGIATFLNISLGEIVYDDASLISAYSQFNHIKGGFYGSTLWLLFGTLIIGGILYFVMTYTKIGLRFRGVGENPNAIDSQGINVYKYQWAGVLLSGFLAGIAGSVFLFATIRFDGSVQGTGFLAIAILITGQWDIRKIAISTIGFALLTAMVRRGIFSEIIGSGKFNVLWEAIPYLITIIVLIFFSKKSKQPKNNGEHFDASRR